MYWRCIYYHILRFNAWFVPFFGWVRLNIEINHINIEPQVQMKAKSIIQFDNQHEFRTEMQSDSSKPEFQYFDIYPHHFWLAACHSINFQAWSVMLVITDDSRHFIITNNGLIHAFSVSIWFEFCSANVTVNWSIDLIDW